MTNLKFLAWTTAPTRVDDALLFVLPPDVQLSEADVVTMRLALAENFPGRRCVIVAGVQQVVVVPRLPRPLTVSRARRVRRG